MYEVDGRDRVGPAPEIPRCDAGVVLRFGDVEALHLVAAGDPADVERRPAAREPIWCA